MTDETQVVQEQDINALIAEAVEKEVSGLKNKNGELIQTNKELKEKLSQFDGLDVDFLKRLKADSEKDTETKLLADGKVDEYVELKTQAYRTETEKLIAQKDQELQNALAQVNQFKQSTIKGTVATLAAQSGVLPEFVDIATMLAQGQFDLYDGQVVGVKDGQVINGKDGKTPLSVNEWLEVLKSEKPSMFRKPEGIGALGSKQTSNTKNPNEMTTAEREELLRTDPVRFKQLFN